MTATLETFRLKAAPGPAPMLLLSDAPAEVNLIERHRPKRLADLAAQPHVVARLGFFVQFPTSCAFVFDGPTGVGKTSTAEALANELGVDPFWGLQRIKAGEQDAEAVADALKMLRYAAPGSGWKLVIVDEADWMSPKAAMLWLSALEDLPPKSIIVFTTNHVDKFQDRFLDRCELIRFDSDATAMRFDAQQLINQIWEREGGLGEAPRFDSLDGVIDTKGRLSLRRVVGALTPMLRERRAVVTSSVDAPKPAPSVEDKPVEQPAVTRTRRDGLDTIDWANVAERRRNGESWRVLAESLGLPETTIRGRLRTLGFITRKASA